MELIECGDCGTILTEAELIDPLFNEVWHEVCDVCFMGYGSEPTLHGTIRALEDAVDTGLALIEKIQKAVCEIKIKLFLG